MDEKERQYQEYLALRQHEQEKEMEKEYFSQPDDKYGQAFPDESKVRHSRRINTWLQERRTGTAGESDQE